MLKKLYFLPAAAFALLIFFSTVTPSRAESILKRPADRGESLFNTHCSVCHGANASGTEKGPPLLHKIYRPNHHSDFSFRRAVQMGVRAHHWRFGNMPKVEGVTPEETEEIIKYIRRIQREAGIY